MKSFEMPLELPIPIDTRPLFRPVSSSLVTLLRGLPLESWELPTVAQAWAVRNIVAHLLDITLRRLSFHRDGMTPPPPHRSIASERDFVAFINTAVRGLPHAFRDVSAEPGHTVAIDIDGPSGGRWTLQREAPVQPFVERPRRPRDSDRRTRRSRPRTLAGSIRHHLKISP